MFGFAQDGGIIGYVVNPGKAIGAQIELYAVGGNKSANFETHYGAIIHQIVAGYGVGSCHKARVGFYAICIRIGIHACVPYRKRIGRYAWVIGCVIGNNVVISGVLVEDNTNGCVLDLLGDEC